MILYLKECRRNLKLCFGSVKKYLLMVIFATSIKCLPKLSGFIVFFHTRIVLSADPVTRYSKLQSTAQTECTWPSIVCSRSILYAFKCPSLVSILHILTFLSLDEVKSTTGQNLHFVFVEDIFSLLRNFTHVINLS